MKEKWKIEVIRYRNKKGQKPTKTDRFLHAVLVTLEYNDVIKYSITILNLNYP